MYAQKRLAVQKVTDGNIEGMREEEKTETDVAVLDGIHMYGYGKLELSTKGPIAIRRSCPVLPEAVLYWKNVPNYGQVLYIYFYNNMRRFCCFTFSKKNKRCCAVQEVIKSITL